MDIWRICLLLCISGSVSGTTKQVFEVFNRLAGIGCLAIDDTIPDNIVITNHVENAHGAQGVNSCDTLFSVKDIPVLIFGRTYNTIVRWDPSKGVFNFKTKLHDVPEEQSNNIVLLILQKVNSFALNFKSCKVGDHREYRIHLQVEFSSGTTINIDAGVSENYAFADASISVLGVYTASAGVKINWNKWSSLALEGNLRVVAVGKDRGYISSLGNVARLIGNGPTEIIIGLQNTLKSANRCLKRGQEYLSEKQLAVKSAHSYFDAGVAKLGAAKQYFEEKNRDLQNKRTLLKTYQANTDAICDIQRCQLICIPRLKRDTCYTFGFFHPCLRKTGCMLEIDHPVCFVNNFVCKTMQGAAYEALEVAQGAVRLAETVVEGAQIALTAAQVVVNESRVSVDSAVAVLNIIEKGIGTVMYVIEKAANGLEAVEYLVNHGVNLTTSIIEVVSDSVIDVRDCGVTEFAYLSTDILESGIEIVCEVNFRGRGYKSVSRRLRLCDMFSPSKCNN